MMMKKSSSVCAIIVDIIRYLDDYIPHIRAR